jgi:replicative DNA helicase
MEKNNYNTKINVINNYVRDNNNPLPHDNEAEEILLGALISDNSSIEYIENGLSDFHFYVPMLGRVFKAVLELNNKDQIANPLTLDHYFSDDTAFNEIGGKKYLLSLCEGNLGSSIVKDYANLLIELFNKRELIKIAQGIFLSSQKLDYEKNSTALIEETEAKLYELTENKQSNNNRLISFSESINLAMLSADKAHKNKGKLSGISSGFIAVDDLLGGLHKSDLIILAGRPSMGKTALATNIAYNAAANKNEKKSIAFFSLEMSAEQLANRILAEQASLSSDQIRRGKLTKEDFSKLSQVSKEISSNKLFIDDTPAINVSTLRTRTRRLKRKLGDELGLVVVDYLQLMRGSKKYENRVQEISEITQGLKSVSKELNVPILALSQLSRAVEQREDKRPHLADLRESGTIEQDADVVIFIYRQEYYEERSEPKSSGTESSLSFHEKYLKWQENLKKCKNIADIIVAKQRHGPIGSLQLHFDAKYTKFSNLTDEKNQPKNSS